MNSVVTSNVTEVISDKFIIIIIIIVQKLTALSTYKSQSLTFRNRASYI